jgi:hypothetical protein
VQLTHPNFLPYKGLLSFGKLIAEELFYLAGFSTALVRPIS